MPESNTHYPSMVYHCKDFSRVCNLYQCSLPQPFYKIKGGVNGEFIYVTGSHFIYDKKQNKFIEVKNFSGSKIQYDIKSDWFSCLITTNRRIKIGKHIFWDWEDDELTKC